MSKEEPRSLPGDFFKTALSREDAQSFVFISVFALLFLVNLLYGYNVERIGAASWYGGREKLNKHTSSGEIFDAGKLTCASWYHPFGTLLRVTNLYNGRRVIVRVNDRGPARRLHRLIDLTKYAFSRIAPLKRGIIKVRIEKIAKKEGYR